MRETDRSAVLLFCILSVLLESISAETFSAPAVPHIRSSEFYSYESFHNQDSRRNLQECACRYGACATTPCCGGLVCSTQSNGYQQCLEDPQYTTSDGTCLTSIQGGCKADSECCNPFSYCDTSSPLSDNYEVCVTDCPTTNPTLEPSTIPTSSTPTIKPTEAPSTVEPTFIPSAMPTGPTFSPTAYPTNPTYRPTAAPTDPTVAPTIPSPTRRPTRQPTFGYNPTRRPTRMPTVAGQLTTSPVSATAPNTAPIASPVEGSTPGTTPSLGSSTATPAANPTSAPLLSSPTMQPSIRPPTVQPTYITYLSYTTIIDVEDVIGGALSLDVASRTAITTVMEAVLEIDHVEHASFVEGVRLLEVKEELFVNRHRHRHLQITSTARIELRIIMSLAKFTDYTNDLLYDSREKLLRDSTRDGSFTVQLTKYANEYKAYDVIQSSVTKTQVSSSYSITDTAPPSPSSEKDGFYDYLSRDAWIVVFFFLVLAVIAIVYIVLNLFCKPDQEQKEIRAAKRSADKGNQFALVVSDNHSNYLIGDSMSPDPVLVFREGDQEAGMVPAVMDVSKVDQVVRSKREVIRKSQGESVLLGYDARLAMEANNTNIDTTFPLILSIRKALFNIENLLEEDPERRHEAIANGYDDRPLPTLENGDGGDGSEGGGLSFTTSAHTGKKLDASMLGHNRNLTTGNGNKSDDSI